MGPACGTRHHAAHTHTPHTHKGSHLLIADGDEELLVVGGVEGLDVGPREDFLHTHRKRGEWSEHKRGRSRLPLRARVKRT